MPKAAAVTTAYCPDVRMTTQTGLQQMPLAIGVNERLDFSLFIAGTNSAVCVRLQTLAGADAGQVYLWGPGGSGKSHLLQATCQLAGQSGLRAAYIPLQQFMHGQQGPELLDGLDSFDLIAVDDLQVIAGSEWEQAMFGFYNRARDAGRTLLFAADSSPRGLPLNLPDLASRLGWGEVFHLQSLGDDDKREALVRRAAARGLELPDDVANYLLRRTVRDMAGLMAWLDHLDKAQLAAQRRLSIPFVKTLLAQTPSDTL